MVPSPRRSLDPRHVTGAMPARRAARPAQSAAAARVITTPDRHRALLPPRPASLLVAVHHRAYLGDLLGAWRCTCFRFAWQHSGDGDYLSWAPGGGAGQRRGGADGGAARLALPGCAGRPPRRRHRAGSASGADRAGCRVPLHDVGGSRGGGGRRCVHGGRSGQAVGGQAQRSTGAVRRPPWLATVPARIRARFLAMQLTSRRAAVGTRCHRPNNTQDTATAHARGTTAVRRPRSTPRKATSSSSTVPRGMRTAAR